MTDTILEISNNLISHLMNADKADIIIYAIGFIGFCILGSLLTRKDRKKNPEKYARMSAAFTSGQDFSVGTVVIDGQAHSVTRSGNTTYID